MKLLNLGQSNKTIFLILIIITALLYHLSILPPVETGQDSVRKWLMMKSLLWSDVTAPYWAWDHHSSRWSINVPILFFRSIFSETVNAYYFPAWSALVVTLLFMYKICIKYMDLGRAIIACLIFIFFEQYSRNANQLVPAIFSNAYILGSFFFLDRSLDNNQKRDFFISIILMFCAYLAKIDNLYFVPGFFIFIYLKQKSFKAIFMYSIVLFSFYLGETLAYYLFTDYPLGRLQIIMNAHVDVGVKAKKMVGISFFEIFDKILVAGSPLIYFIFFTLIYAPFMFFKKRNNILILKVLLLMSIGYYFLKLFIMKDYSPFVPLERNKERYLLAAVPFMIIFFTQIMYLDFKKYFDRFNFKILKGFLIILFTFLIGKNIYQVYHGEHRLQKNTHIYKVLNYAYKSKIPIISKHRKDLHNAYRFYLDKEFIIKDGVYIHDNNTMPTFYDNGKQYSYLIDSKELLSQDSLKSCHIYIYDKYYGFELKNCKSEFNL